jgi:branched-chain amino acid transport system ATP-binding protein
MQILQLAHPRTEASLRAPVPLPSRRVRNVSADTKASGQSPVLELKGLSKSFGGLHAVRGVTFKIMSGDRKAIIGPNGAGKTTLFNLITGIFPSSAGQVLLFGNDVTTWQSHRRTALGMARTFQVTSLFPRLTVLDNVLLAIKGLRTSKFVMWRFLSSYRDVYDKAHQLLEQAGFTDRANTEVRYLSHGEQRQLEIVLGLASNPKILLLDEPAAGLSSGESVEMTKFLMKLDPKLAILLIEHDMDVVFDLAHTISVLHFGEILETGAPEQIKNSQKVQEIYLGTG